MQQCSKYKPCSDDQGFFLARISRNRFEEKWLFLMKRHAGH